MPVSVPVRQDEIVIPDLAARCTFPFKVSPLYEALSVESREWYSESDRAPMDEKHAEYDSLNPALLAAMVYPDADGPRLRVCIDFIAWTFYLDNLTDDMDNTGNRTVGEVIMHSFHHPFTVELSSRIAVLASECVLIWDVYLFSILTIFFHQVYRTILCPCQRWMSPPLPGNFREVPSRSPPTSPQPCPKPNPISQGVHQSSQRYLWMPL